MSQNREEGNVFGDEYCEGGILQEELPDYQNRIIDELLEAIQKNPDRLRLIEELYIELAKND